MARTIYDTLDSLLRLYFDKGASDGEKESAMVMFKRKCKKAGVNPEEYLENFKRQQNGTGDRANSRASSGRSNNSRQSNGHGFGDFGFGGYNYRSAYENSDRFWEDFFSGLDFGSGPEESEQERREREKRERERKRKEEERRKNANKYPPHTVQNVKFKVRKSRFSWATLVECEEFVDGVWVPSELVIFSDEFEFPRGYRELKFRYEPGNKYYYGGKMKVSKMWFYEEVTKQEFIIFDEDEERGIRELTEEIEIEIHNSEFIYTQLSSDELMDKYKAQVRSMVIDKIEDIDPESIRFKSVMKRLDEIRMVHIYKFTVGYKIKKETILGGVKMEKCKNCSNYNDEDTYKGTGYCELNDVYVKEDDSCEDWED